MIYFLARRLLQAIIVVLVLSLVMYLLVSWAIDPLADLRTTTATNKQEQIANRIAMLNLDKPVLLRYVWWLGGAAGCFIGKCDLGSAWKEHEPVTQQLTGAMAASFELIFAATIIAIILGVIVGVVSALRQYTGFDYFITFVSFVLFSLPVFWVAVLLKQYLAIDLNNYLNNPGFSLPIIIILALLSGLLWMAAFGGRGRRRVFVFTAATVVTFVVEFYILSTGWLENPHIGIVGVAIIGAAAAIAITVLSAGLHNKRALYSAFTMAAVGVALYYPLKSFFLDVPANFGIIVGLFFLTIAIGVLIGYLFGGPDPGQSVRGTILTGIIVALAIFIDRTMLVWSAYSHANEVHNRPIATIGASTPNLGGDFWVHTTDVFTHLLLPSVALILIAFAEFTRFTRGSMLEVMSLDYIRTARAKGLTERTVVMRHALRNSLLPLASIVPRSIMTIVGGAVITETIFGWYGMGRLFVDSLNENEIDPVMAFIVIIGLLSVLATLVSDLMYSVLDPRVRVSS
jgi:peptide/nickel transport system permease protein